MTSYGFIDGMITRRPEQHFLDFVVDGRPLRDRIVGAEDLVTPLCRTWSADSVATALDELLGRSEPPEQRVEILVCGVCGDVDCNGVTARLTLTPSAVAWSDFCWETPAGTTPVEGLPPRMTFERSEYEAAFNGAFERLGAFPYDRLAHRGRRFLWPWQWGWRAPRP